MQNFQDTLTSTVRAAKIPPRMLGEGECQSSRGVVCRLCHARELDYPAEIQLKNQALQQYWKTLRIGVSLDRVIASPLGRHYRTTSKRKVFPLRDSIRLGLISPDEQNKLHPLDIVQCAIEPAQHQIIFSNIQESIVKPYAKPLARALTYAIVKGNYKEHTVILNVNEISLQLVRVANTLSKTLTKKNTSIVGVFLYEGSSNDGYYLGTKGKSAKQQVKKLFGKPQIFQSVIGRKFLFSPMVFSQINQSLLEKMLRTAEELLQPTSSTTLFDLYCGYGIFALSLAEKVKQVVGVELSHLSIESAIDNAKRQHVQNARFLRSDINDETIERIMHHASEEDVVLLDPPRSGTSEGVIETIAAKSPRRVLHIFCEIDLIPRELKRWAKAGYKPLRAIPLDMFPGTATIETMILLEKD